MSDVAVDLSAALCRGPFEELDDETREALADAASVHGAVAGVALTPPASDDALVIVLAGAADVVDVTPGQEPVRLRALGPASAYDRRQLSAFVEDLEARATEPTTYATIPASTLDALLPGSADLRAAFDRLRRRTLLTRLHGLFGALDEDFLDQLEQMAFWQSLPRGTAMPVRADLPDLFLVVSGRVRVLRDAPDGTTETIGEAALGESVTEDAFFGVEAPESRVLAVRDSVLVGFSPEEFDRIVTARPAVLRRVTRSLVQRLHRPRRRAAAAPITNVAVVPLVAPDRATAFVTRLQDALGHHGSVLALSADEVERRLATPGLAEVETGPDADALGAWLDAREHDHRFVLYVADRTPSAWTRRCLRQADRVLYVADVEADPRPDAAERDILAYTDRLVGAIETLVLLHRDGSQLPRHTRRWLEPRRVEGHVHVRWDRDDDIARLARVLAGRAVGLALGGGGARGFAHIGTLRAFAEAGIPIDYVGGTSMGANMAAQHAMGWTADRMVAANRRIWIELAPQKNYTLPLVSVLAAQRSEACARMMYGDFDIEDLWIPFFCVSSDLTAAAAVIHETGSLQRAVTASSSLPGIAVPVLHNGHLLVDGGLLDNLPATILRSLGCGTVVAAEVTVETDAAFSVDRVPTPWEALRGRFRRSRPVAFPTIGDLAMRAAMLHSTNRMREALETADLSLHPPVDDYRLMDFEALDQLVGIGTDHARERVSEWCADATIAARLSVGAAPAAVPVETSVRRPATEPSVAG